MCIVCLEFMKGTLTDDEAYNALSELTTDQLEDTHASHEVADMAYDHIVNVREDFLYEGI